MTKKKKAKKAAKKATKKVAKPKMIDVEIDLPIDLIEWAEKAAKAEGITFNEFVNNAVRDFIKSNPL